MLSQTHPSTNLQQPSYPNFINQAQSNKLITLQRSITMKIISSIKSHNKLNNQLIHKISTYIFTNPITLSYPLYKQIPTHQITNGQYLLYSATKNNMIVINIINFWNKIQQNNTNTQNVMKFANHLNEFINIKNNSINSNNQYDKINIISKNANYFQALLKTITQYHKDRIINEYVIQAYHNIITKTMVHISIQHNDQYIIIHPSTDHQSKYHNIQTILLKYWTNNNYYKKINICFEFGQNNLQILSDEYSLYKLTQKLPNRQKQLLLNPYTYQQIIIQDIYIN